MSLLKPVRFLKMSSDVIAPDIFRILNLDMLKMKFVIEKDVFLKNN